jgi:putative tryptophan/tyrosine transport system substrate-binding protein
MARDSEGIPRGAKRRRNVGGIALLENGMFWAQRQQIVTLTKTVPSMYWNEEFVRIGGLMSYAPSYSDLARRAAAYVDKIFKGAKPADLPVEEPTKFDLVINLKTAKALGLTIPRSLLLRADQVID